MIMRSLFCSSLIFFLSGLAVGQVPSVQIKFKEQSGFLGMGGPRVVQVDLANQTRTRPLTSENVNAGPHYYFLLTPAGDWALDADFIKEDLSRLTVYQNEQRVQLSWKGDIITDEKTTLLVGFPKTILLHQLFLFQVQIDEGMAQAEFKVPQEFWPGFATLMEIVRLANAAVAEKQYRAAIQLYDQVLSDPGLTIFPQYEDAKIIRTRAFDGYLAERAGTFSTITVDPSLDLKQKIAQIDAFRPTVQYVVDSLPRAAWNIGSLDAAVAPILNRARTTLSNVTLVRDSLQLELDDLNVRWIIEGSATGKNGYLYQYMIETLAYALSSLNFTDTAATDLAVMIPEDQEARLVKYNIKESYETFIRMANDRYQSRLPMLPIDFLPNLRKDTAAFPLPFYSMLRAVNDYYYGNPNSALEEIFRIFQSCYEPDLTARFDHMRVIIRTQQAHVPMEVLRMLDEAEQLALARNTDGALEKYRQATIIAPEYAYAYFALGKHYVRTGEPIRAITFFQRAYQIDTLYLTAYRESYNLYLKQGNYKPVIEVLTIALDRGNDYWEVNSNLGNAYMGDNDPARAIQHFERALAINPRSYKTNIQLGLAHQTVKNFQKAREYFNRAIDLDPLRQDAVDFLTKLNELQKQAR